MTSQDARDPISGDVGHPPLAADPPVTDAPSGPVSPGSTYHVLPTNSRRTLLVIIAKAVLSAIALVTVVIVITGGKSSTLLGAAVGLGIGLLITGLRQRAGQTVTLSRDGITYTARLFTLQAPWEDVGGLVHLGRPSGPLAILLTRPSSAREGRLPLGAPWRRQPYPYDRIIPLDPFVGGADGGPLLGDLRAAQPELFDGPAGLVAPAAVQWRLRLAGLAIALLTVPLLVGGLAIAYQLLGLVLTTEWALIEAAVLAGTLVCLLRRWQPGGGERTVDFIGRALFAPRPGERRTQVVRPLGGAAATLLLALIVGVALGRLSVAPGPGTASGPLTPSGHESPLPAYSTCNQFAGGVVTSAFPGGYSTETKSGTDAALGPVDETRVTWSDLDRAFVIVELRSTSAPWSVPDAGAFLDGRLHASIAAALAALHATETPLQTRSVSLDDYLCREVSATTAGGFEETARGCLSASSFVLWFASVPTADDTSARAFLDGLRLVGA